MNMGRLNKVGSCSLLLTFALQLWAQSRSSDLSQPDFSSVRKLIQEQVASKGTPSMSVAVGRNGKILWEEGFGWADPENHIPATEHTMYYTASVTKLFTETALMMLQERKQLNLEHPVNEYLGTAKLSSPAWNANEATVRQVATHTAGLTTYNPAHRLPIERAISRYGVLFWPPGERFDYSNLGPIVLEEVIARVSRKNYADFLVGEVFRPLGLAECSFGIGPDREKHAAKRYSAVGGLQPAAEGGVYCSADDLARFGMFHLKAHLRSQKAILSDASIDAMQNSTVPTLSPFGRYGFAWRAEEDRYGFRSVLAQGGTVADQAWLRLIPSEGIAVVVLSNIGDAPNAQIIDDIISTLLPSYGEKRAKATTSAGQPQSTNDKLPSQAMVGNWTGLIRTYRGDLPLSFSIRESGQVDAKLGSQPGTLLDEVRFHEGKLSGRMPGDLSVDDAGPAPYNLHFWLYLRGEILNGAAVTEPSPQLPYWTELKKVSHDNGPEH